MAAETVRQFDALEAQAQAIMAVFQNAGHEAVSPAVIQPADVFLDVIGESLRARTYVFTDPDGAELCLRPDLTVPTCRLHLARYSDPVTPAKYAYNGAAFRFQPQGANEAHPREFYQAGIERFGDVSREAAEANTIALIVRAIEKAGLSDWSLHLGDLELFQSVLAAAGLSPRWQKRLGDAFQRPAEFRESLQGFSKSVRPKPRSVPDALLGEIRGANAEVSEGIVQRYFAEAGIEAIGTRTLREIAEHLSTIAEDRNETPLPPAAVDLIRRYVALSGPAAEAGQRIADLLKRLSGRQAVALEAYDRRLALLANAGIDLDRVTFSAEFGRSFAYYSGLVFEVRHPSLDEESPIAGGGRYDGLMRAAGAAIDVPAVGAAIYTDRLLNAVKRGRG